MAVSAMSSFELPQRRKIVTYGKKPNASTSYRPNEDDEKNTLKTMSGTTAEGSSRPGWKSPLKRQISDALSNGPKENQDVFEVPSDDDDAAPAPKRPAQPSKLSSTAISRKAVPPSKTNRISHSTQDISQRPAKLQPNANTKRDVDMRPSSPKKKPNHANQLATKSHPAKSKAPSVFDVPSSEDEAGPSRDTKARQVPSEQHLSNALPAKPQSGSLSNQRAVVTNSTRVGVGKKEPAHTNSVAEPPRKRRKPTPTRSISSVQEDANTGSAGSSTRCSSVDFTTRSVSPTNRSSALKRTAPVKNQHSQTKHKKESATHTQRRPVSGPSSRVLLSKGLSSPAILEAALLSPNQTPTKSAPIGADMMDLDEAVDTHDVSHTQSEQVPRPSLTKSFSATPKQKQLWDNLLDSSEMISTVKKLKFSALHIEHESPEKPTAAPDIALRKAPQRRRLIDTLKQDLPQPDEDSVSDEDSDEGPSTHESSMDARTEPRQQEITHRAVIERQPSGMGETVIAESQSSGVSAPGLRVTYAKQRSYLQDSMIDDIANMDFLIDDDMPVNSVATRRGMPSSQRRDPFDIDSDESDDGAASFRNIHELRAAGQNKRMKAEVETLLEDLEQSDLSRSTKRSAMLELALKLAEKDFRSHFLDMGLVSRFVRDCIKGCADDVILGYSFAAALAFIIKDDVSQMVLNDIHQSSSISSMLHLLVQDTSIDKIAKERGTNMSRMAISSMASLHRLVKQASLWEGVPPETASPRLLAMRNLEILLKGLRQAGFEGRLLSPEVLLKILSIAKSIVDDVSDEQESQTSRVLCLRLSLSTARSAFLGKVATTQALTGPVLESLLDTLQAVLASSCLSDEVETLVLQLILSLTNGDERVLKAISVPELVQPLTSLVESRFNLLSGSIQAEQWDVTLNNLNLGLGTLVNLCEHSDEARQAMIYDSDALLVSLLDIFVSNCKRSSQAESVQESQVNVAGGLLAVLLGTICQEATIRHKVRDKLPRNSLEPLINAVEEFALYNQKVDQLMHDRVADVTEEEKSELWSNYKEYTEQLRGVASRLKDFEVNSM